MNLPEVLIYISETLNESGKNELVGRLRISGGAIDPMLGLQAYK